MEEMQIASEEMWLWSMEKEQRSEPTPQERCGE
jgi:hypothetical protein